jgi:hypothetical protein
VHSLAQIESTQFHREFSVAHRDHLERFSNVAAQGFSGFPGTLLGRPRLSFSIQTFLKTAF